MKGIFKQSIPAVMIMAISLFQTTIHAESICKGLNMSSCSANSACTWVTGYVTKNGTKVNEYCRVNSGKKHSIGKTESNDNYTIINAEKTKEG